MDAKAGEGTSFFRSNDGYFHHGDLHAGNIMINKDYATVLDFGNCTTLDNSTAFFSSQIGRVTAILKMMAAAFAGFSDDFIESLEGVIALEGEKNDFNSLTSEEKKITVPLKKTVFLNKNCGR